MNGAWSLRCRRRVIGNLLRKFGRCGTGEGEQFDPRRRILPQQLIEKCYQRRALSCPRTREDSRVPMVIVSEDCDLFCCGLVGHSLILSRLSLFL